MELIEQIRFPRAAASAAVDPSGEWVAAAVGDSEPIPEHFPGDEYPQAVHLFRFAEGRLQPERVIPLPPTPVKRRRTGETGRKFKDTKVAFLDADRLFAARMAVRVTAPGAGLNVERVELIALDVGTGAERGRFVSRKTHEINVTGLVAAPPDHLLIGVQKDVICVAADDLTEICRARRVDRWGDVIEKGATPEEGLAPDGFAYDPDSRLLYLLPSVFNEAFLHCRRLEPQNRRFVRVFSRSVLRAQAHDAAGLCLTPGGGSVTASLQVMDSLVDLEGQPVRDWQAFHERMLAIADQMPKDPEPPLKARLGCLAILTEREERYLDVHSETARDFSFSPQYAARDSSTGIKVGWRLSAGAWDSGEYMTAPLYLDDRRVLVGTPSGFLLRLDMETGASEVVHDFKATISALRLHPEGRHLLAATEDGTLSLFSMG